MSDPVDFNELPPEVRAFLGNLTEEKVSELEASIAFSRSVKTVSKFFRWLIIGVVAFVVATAALGDAAQKIYGWVAPAFRAKSGG